MPYLTLSRRTKFIALMSSGINTALSFSLTKISTLMSSLTAGTAYLSASIYSIAKNNEVTTTLIQEADRRRATAHAFNNLDTYSFLLNELRNVEAVVMQLPSVPNVECNKTGSNALIEFDPQLEIPLVEHGRLQTLLTGLYGEEQARRILGLLTAEQEIKSKARFWNYTNVVSQLLLTALGIGLHQAAQRSVDEEEVSILEWLNVFLVPAAVTLQYVVHGMFAARKLGQIRAATQALHTVWESFPTMQTSIRALQDKQTEDTVLVESAIEKIQLLQELLKQIIEDLGKQIEVLKRNLRSLRSNNAWLNTLPEELTEIILQNAIEAHGEEARVLIDQQERLYAEIEQLTDIAEQFAKAAETLPHYQQQCQDSMQPLENITQLTV